MCSWIAFLLLLVTLSLPAVAGIEKDCARAFSKIRTTASRPPILRRFVFIPKSAEETRAESAKITSLATLRPHFRLIDSVATNKTSPALDLLDGHYVWVVDESDRVGILPRAIFSAGARAGNTKQILGSHSGLELLFKKDVPDFHGFVAAGELVIRGGQTMMLNNKAGTFRGGADSLEWGHARLIQSGLKTDEQTVVQDISKTPMSNGHATVLTQVESELTIARDPKLRSTYSRLQKIMNHVQKNNIDPVDLATRLMDEGQMTAGYHAGTLVERWQQPNEGTAFWFLQSYRQLGSDHEVFNKFLDSIEANYPSHK